MIMVLVWAQNPGCRIWWYSQLYNWYKLIFVNNKFKIHVTEKLGAGPWGALTFCSQLVKSVTQMVTGCWKSDKIYYICSIRPTSFFCKIWKIWDCFYISHHPVIYNYEIEIFIFTSTCCTFDLKIFVSGI